MFYEVNYVAVLLATVAAFFVGWLWYGPLFGKQWMAMMGYHKDNMKEMKMKPMNGMVIAFISTLIMAYVLSIFMGMWPYSIYKLAFLIWLGFIVPIELGSVLWENRSWNLFCFNAAYQLVIALVLTTVISMVK